MLKIYLTKKLKAMKKTFLTAIVAVAAIFGAVNINAQPLSAASSSNDNDTPWVVKTYNNAKAGTVKAYDKTKAGVKKGYTAVKDEFKKIF